MLRRQPGSRGRLDDKALLLQNFDATVPALSYFCSNVFSLGVVDHRSKFRLTNQKRLYIFYIISAVIEHVYVLN